MNLHLQPLHPLNTIKRAIESHFNAGSNPPLFTVVDTLPPVVTTANCFDALLIPSDHISRSPSDTYYVNDVTCLRTHTSAHQSPLLKSGLSSFLATGDVYRRDEIDESHYPVFHQMEGVRMFPVGTPSSVIESDLKVRLSGLATTLFGNVEMRWNETYFPFTTPSYELEILFNGHWLEVLGCGVIQQQIIREAGRGEEPGWAFGLGLERLAMVLFQIPDIRLFWSTDIRFHEQFKDGKIGVKFQPYSKYPFVYKDISFWTTGGGGGLKAGGGGGAGGGGASGGGGVGGGVDSSPPPSFHANDLCEIVRGVCPIGEDIIEKVSLIDEFTHPTTKRMSKCFRITYRSMDRNLTNDEIDKVQEQVRAEVVEKLGVVLR